MPSGPSGRRTGLTERHGGLHAAKQSRGTDPDEKQQAHAGGTRRYGMQRLRVPARSSSRVVHARTALYTGLTKVGTAMTLQKEVR
jgi:hypothetical protein